MGSPFILLFFFLHLQVQSTIALAGELTTPATTTSTTFVAADTSFGVLANAASSSCFVLYFSFVFYVEFDFAKVRLGVAPGSRAAVFARAGLNHLADGVQ